LKRHEQIVTELTSDATCTAGQEAIERKWTRHGRAASHRESSISIAGKKLISRRNTMNIEQSAYRVIFVRNYHGSAADQITLYRWICLTELLIMF